MHELLSTLISHNIKTTGEVNNIDYIVTVSSVGIDWAAMWVPEFHDAGEMARLKYLNESDKSPTVMNS